jgi:hypothetical protein
MKLGKETACVKSVSFLKFPSIISTLSPNLMKIGDWGLAYLII